MDRLAGLARPDGDHLSEVELQRRALGEHEVGRVQHERVHHQLASRGGAGDQGTGAPGGRTREVVATHRRAVEPGLHVPFEPVEQLGLGQALDDAAPVVTEGTRELGCGRVGGEPLDRHGPQYPAPCPLARSGPAPTG
jgi:hypothetical protein